MVLVEKQKCAGHSFRKMDLFSWNMETPQGRKLKGEQVQVVVVNKCGDVLNSSKRLGDERNVMMSYVRVY